MKLNKTQQTVLRAIMGTNDGGYVMSKPWHCPLIENSREYEFALDLVQLGVADMYQTKSGTWYVRTVWPKEQKNCE